MKRTPLVLACTVAGLAGVTTFRSTPQKITLGPLSTTPSASAPAPASPAAGPPGSTAPSAPPAPSSGVRSATGPVVNYFYGQLSVRVTASGTTVTSVTIATLSDGGNPYSAYVDHASLPMLVKQALAAQSANIQGVSGASYTSAGFAQSLHGALSSLGLK